MNMIIVFFKITFLNPGNGTLGKLDQILIFAKYQEVAFRRCSTKKVFPTILQNSKENTCVGISFLIKLQACLFINKVAGVIRPANLFKKRL